MTGWELAGVALTLAVLGALVVWRERAKRLARDTVTFGAEVRAEVEKITWPTREELRKATVVILAFVAFVAMLIGIIDVILQQIVVKLPGRLV